jgi:hypothetical protein
VRGLLHRIGNQFVRSDSAGAVLNTIMDIVAEATSEPEPSAETGGEKADYTGCLGCDAGMEVGIGVHTCSKPAHRRRPSREAIALDTAAHLLAHRGNRDWSEKNVYRLDKQVKVELQRLFDEADKVLAGWDSLEQRTIATFRQSPSPTQPGPESVQPEKLNTVHKSGAESSLSSNDTFPPKTITTSEPMIVEDNKSSLSSESPDQTVPMGCVRAREHLRGEPHDCPVSSESPAPQKPCDYCKQDVPLNSEGLHEWVGTNGGKYMQRCSAAQPSGDSTQPAKEKE